MTGRREVFGPMIADTDATIERLRRSASISFMCATFSTCMAGVLWLECWTDDSRWYVTAGYMFGQLARSFVNGWLGCRALRKRRKLKRARIHLDLAMRTFSPIALDHHLDQLLALYHSL